MTDAAATKRNPGWLGFALDFGPLLLFFLAYRLAGPGENPISAAIIGTATFMVAILVALLVSKWRLGRVQPMLWLSAVLVIGFGALTLWFRDPAFIQLKPTLIYAFFALLLLGGWLRGRALLKYLLAHAFDGLSDRGWLLLSRNWGLFFVALALANEVMRATMSFDLWLTVKVWGVTGASLVFGLAQLPLLLRHGLRIEEPEAPPTA